MSLLDTMRSALTLSKPTTLLSLDQQKEVLHRLLKDLWEKADDKSKYCKTQWGYWEGELINKLVMTAYFPDQTRSNANVIKPIIETILKNMLDAQFTIAVLPDLGSFYDLQAIKDARDIADILTDEIQNIFKDNDINSIQEQVGRAGELCGFGVSQVVWDTKERSDGEIKVKYLDSGTVKWNKNANHKKVNMIAYEEELNVSEAKDLYAKNPDGTFDEDMCQKIDEISETLAGDSYRKQTGAVINYVNTSNNTAGRAFVDGGVKGIQAGRIVKLINMYLLDDSVYAPDEKDDEETQEQKQEYIKAYPNGRFIVFSLANDKKLILKDEPLSESFKNLGNIDVYNPTYFKDLSGKSSIDDLVDIQNRINGLCAKYREKIQWDLDTILVDADFGIEDNAIVRSGITRVEGYNENRKPMSEPMSTASLDKAANILEMINGLIEFAYKTARVNETMLYGSRQTGTTSGEQVEMLQESPMADIRARQRNFSQWIIGIAEKCLRFIIENYTQQRLIQLSTGIDGATMAKMDTNEQGQRYIELYREANGAVQRIKTLNLSDNIKFKIECVAGTDIPRSRKETAKLVDEIIVNPIMQSGNLDLIEMYLTAKDFPQRRALMSLLRRQAEEAAKKPQSFTIKDIIQNPVWGKNAADILSALSKGGFTTDISLLLKQIGLTGQVDTLETTPIKDITSRSSVQDVAAIGKGKVSTDPQKDEVGRIIAGTIVDKQYEKKGIM